MISTFEGDVESTSPSKVEITGQNSQSPHGRRFFRPCFVNISCGRGSVSSSDGNAIRVTLCTSGFVDDVI